jgi:TolB-like protein/Flp pilus assembly protein TadD
VIYQFADVTLDPARRELLRDGTLVAVEPQVFDLLKLLIEARERVVTRDELLNVVWHGRIVSDATLSSRLNAARAAVGDTGVQQRLIRTLPRRGIRFVGQVQEVSGLEPDQPAGTGSPASAGCRNDPHKVPSVAVLPFANMSGDPAQDFFADGMAEEIITALSRSSALLVIARSSSFAYRGAAIDVRRAGLELGAAYVLEGSVRRSRGRLRITGQLIDAVSGLHLWSDRFEGSLRDVFELQDRVADSVAAAIEPALQMAEIGRVRRDPPARLDAYDLLLRGYGLMSDFTAAGMTAALGHFGEALAVDPAYAPAMAGSAYCRAQCDFQGWARQNDADRTAAVQLAWQAAELAANDAQVLWMSAFSIWAMARTGRDRAREMFRRALLVNPNSAMALTLAGWIETMCGNQDVGREMVARARRLNPRDPRGWLTSGVLALAAIVDEDYSEAAAWAERTLAQNRRFAVALRVLAVARVKLGEPDQARRAVKELLAIEPELTLSGLFARIPFPLQRMEETYAEALKAAGLPE